MKNSQTCPKCDANDIVKIPGNTVADGSGNNINVGMTILNAIKVTRYMCGNCGFSEEWIDDKKDIEKLKKTFG